MQSWLLGTYLLSLLLLSACQPQSEEAATSQTSGPYAHIPDAQARQLLQNAIESAGGLENWQNLQELRFQKYYALYDSSGATETEARQTHVYRFTPEKQVTISWEAEGEKQMIRQQKEKVVRIAAGEPDTSADPQALRNNVLSAVFVVSIPFKLLDPGVELSYAGRETLENLGEVEVLKAVYNPGQHDHHSTPDTWWHYYHPGDFRQVGYKVQHAGHYSYVINRSFAMAKGFRFPRERDSYRVDAQGNRLYLRAAYEYSDYRVEGIN